MRLYRLRNRQFEWGDISEALVWARDADEARRTLAAQYPGEVNNRFEAEEVEPGDAPKVVSVNFPT